jgi:hypothetical protein
MSGRSIASQQLWQTVRSGSEGGATLHYACSVNGTP